MLVKQPEEGARSLRPHGDMASCYNSLCPSKAVCWRFMKPAHTRQVYQAFEVPAGEDRCDDYIPILDG